MYGNQLLGLSLSQNDDFAIAADVNIDYVGVGAIFPTQTKIDANVSGLELYQKALEQFDFPVFALGGITENNVKPLKDVAEKANKKLRICVSSAILKSENPSKTTEKIHKIIKNQ